MSCIRNNFNFYTTMPPREWYRFASQCPDKTQHSTNDLNMRRKAEILKYKRNSTNNLTKKEKWALISKGKWKKRKGWESSINSLVSSSTGNSFSCLNGGNMCAYSTSSDIPGKKTLLCLDETVPLYMYNVQRSYITGSYNELSLDPSITDGTITIDSGVYFSLTQIGKITAQDFFINYSTELVFEIIGGNINNIFSVDTNTGVVYAKGVVKESFSTVLQVTVTNIFNFTVTGNITINITPTESFSGSLITNYSSTTIYYPPLENAPSFSDPIIPPFETPEDITNIYPTVVPPTTTYIPPPIETLIPPIVPPNRLCNCFC